MSRGRAPWQLKWVTLVLVWGSSFLLMMVALRGFTPWQIVAARILLAALTIGRDARSHACPEGSHICKCGNWKCRRWRVCWSRRTCRRGKSGLSQLG